jgi:hypothetical protein
MGYWIFPWAQSISRGNCRPELTPGAMGVEPKGSDEDYWLRSFAALRMTSSVVGCWVQEIN